METILKSIKPVALIMFLGISLSASHAMGWALSDVFKNLHTNTTTPGNFQDAAAGYYSGGGMAVRTKNTAINPLSMTPPSLSTGCGGIDAYLGSFSMISGGEVVNIANNIGSEAVAYGFHLGLKTYAPQIEQTLSTLRDLAMSLSQHGLGQCKTVQAAFAALTPQSSAMYETVCQEMANSDGSVDLGGQRKKCNNFLKQKAAVEAKQKKDPEIMMDNYNIFIKAATAVGIPKEMHEQLMSMVGTIVVRDTIVIPYPSLANDTESWNAHIKGGTNTSMYSCDNSTCLTVGINNSVAISEGNSYTGKAKKRLKELVVGIIAQTTEFTEEDKGFLDSLGQAFPIFDHLMLDAVSGMSILEPDSHLIARYMLVSHLEKVTNEIKKGVYYLKNKQMTAQIIKDYEKQLDDVLVFARTEWAKVMVDADRVNDRADKIWKHLMARERG